MKIMMMVDGCQQPICYQVTTCPQLPQYNEDDYDDDDKDDYDDDYDDDDDDDDDDDWVTNQQPVTTWLQLPSYEDYHNDSCGVNNLEVG